MDVSSTSGATSAPNNGPANRDMATALTGLNLDDFFKLMIAEMQNQDPLNPLENHQLLQQISAIQEYGATQQLSQTLDSVLMGQNITNATSLIGKNVTALTDEGNEVSGAVDRVTISGNSVKVHMGDNQISMSNIRQVLPA